jgi:hypothetical protein
LHVCFVALATEGLPDGLGRSRFLLRKSRQRDAHLVRDGTGKDATPTPAYLSHPSHPSRSLAPRLFIPRHANHKQVPVSAVEKGNGGKRGEIGPEGRTHLILPCSGGDADERDCLSAFGCLKTPVADLMRCRELIDVSPNESKEKGNEESKAEDTQGEAAA